MAGFDELPCGYLRIDDQRVIVEANEEAARLVQRPRDELLGQKLKVLLPVASRVFFQTHVLPELSMRERLDEVYLGFLTSSGDEVPMLLNARRYGSEARRSYVLVFLPMQRRHLFERELIHARDVAERAALAEQRALAQVREIQTQLALQDRLASMGTLAAGVAHEINNPLSFVLGNLELMAELLRGVSTRSRGVDPQELTPLLGEARDGVVRIRDIVRSLKSLSRVDENRRVPVDLRAVVETALRLSSHELRVRAPVSLDLPALVPFVDADEGQLVQVTVNLIVNAAHAMPERPFAENRIAVRVRAGGDGMARIEVEDNGAGMTPEVQRRIFDPFFTTKAVGLGTGLGLSVCHGIVTSLGGTIEVASVVGEGTTFRIALPLSEQVAELRPRVPRRGSSRPPSTVALPTPRSGIRASTSGHQYRIAVVDDEESVLRTLKRALREFDLTLINDAREMVSRVEGGETFDAILCDLMMPSMSGAELFEKLEELAPQQARRMIFMTGGTFTEGATLFLESVTNPRFEKPFNVTAIREECRRVAAGEATRREHGVG